MSLIHIFRREISKAFLDAQYSMGTHGEIADKAADLLISRFGLQEFTLEKMIPYDLELYHGKQDAGIVQYEMEKQFREEVAHEIAMTTAFQITKRTVNRDRGTKFVCSTIAFTQLP
jgi:hypothetical protein